MSNTDQTHRFLFDNTDIRGEVTHLKQAYQDAYSHQSIPEALIPVFGQFLAAASLLSEILKFEGLLTLQAKGDGDVALIMAETDHLGHVRGIVRLPENITTENTSAEIDYDRSLPELLGKANLSITIDPKRGERYQGVVALAKPTLAECLCDYFENSEQLPTKIHLYSDQTNAGGLFLQCLPMQEVDSQETRDDQWQTVVQLADTCTAEELFSLDSEQMLYRLFNEFDCRIFEPKSIQYRCSCSRERSANALVSIGEDEAYALIKEQTEINIGCQFCGQDYIFNQDDIRELFSPDQSVH